MEIVNSLWVERYRPKKLAQLILPKDQREDFETYIQKREIPHLLLSGPPGSGKTAVSMILCSKEGIMNHRNDNLLVVNGSAKETRGISFVQDVIEPFLRVPPSGDDKYKIVFIDESEFLTENSFHALRHIIEKYSENCRFILTCNYVSKIPDALHSRLTPYIFKQMGLDFVYEHCRVILNDEKVSFEENDLKFVVDGFYPDIRKIINRLQKFSMTGTLKVNKEDSISNEKVIISNIAEIINHIQKNEDHKISAVIGTLASVLNDFDIDYRSIFGQLFNMSKMPVPAKIIVNKYTNSFGDCLIPSQHFSAMVYDIILVLQKYRNLATGKK